MKLAEEVSTREQLELELATLRADVGTQASSTAGELETVSAKLGAAEQMQVELEAEIESLRQDLGSYRRGQGFAVGPSKAEGPKGKADLVLFCAMPLPIISGSILTANCPISCAGCLLLLFSIDEIGPHISSASESGCFREKNGDQIKNRDCGCLDRIGKAAIKSNELSSVTMSCYRREVKIEFGSGLPSRVVNSGRSCTGEGR